MVFVGPFLDGHCRAAASGRRVTFRQVAVLEAASVQHLLMLGQSFGLPIVSLSAEGTLSIFGFLELVKTR